MKTIIATVAGTSGSGTSALAARIASILSWPFASFGSYVRAEAARQGFSGTRHELQDVGVALLRDTEGFCRAVIAQSYWRPGQSLIVDGLRHREVLDTLRRLLSPTEVTEIYLNADDSLREARLRERGEIPDQGLLGIDAHPVESEVPTVLRQLAQITVDAQLPQEEQVDQLVEYLMQHAEIPPLDSWITREYLMRIPQKIRTALDLNPGDRVEFDSVERAILVYKVVDEDRIRSVFGRLRQELQGVDPKTWIRSIRSREDITGSSDEGGN